jgi:hypothetical protein
MEIDLSAEFPKYRIIWEESDTSRHKDPAYMEIAGRCGKVYSHGDGRLQGWLNAGHGKLKERIRAMPNVEIWQEGDEEMTFLFALDQAKVVFSALGIKRRRRDLGAKHQRRRNPFVRSQRRDALSEPSPVRA